MIWFNNNNSIHSNTVSVLSNYQWFKFWVNWSVRSHLFGLLAVAVVRANAGSAKLPWSPKLWLYCLRWTACDLLFVMENLTNCHLQDHLRAGHVTVDLVLFHIPIWSRSELKMVTTCSFLPITQIRKQWTSVTCQGLKSEFEHFLLQCEHSLSVQNTRCLV